MISLLSLDKTAIVDCTQNAIERSQFSSNVFVATDANRIPLISGSLLGSHVRIRNQTVSSTRNRPSMRTVIRRKHSHNHSSKVLATLALG